MLSKFNIGRVLFTIYNLLDVCHHESIELEFLAEGQGSYISVKSN